jgi:hypothetical protein
MRPGSQWSRAPWLSSVWTAVDWMIDGFVAGFAGYGDAMHAREAVARDASSDGEREDTSSPRRAPTNIVYLERRRLPPSASRMRARRTSGTP